jgi:DNA-binding beta-propeller fold protein YncE
MRRVVLLWLALSLPALAATPLGSYRQNLRAPTRVATGPGGSVYVVDSATGQVAIFDAFGRYVGAVTAGAKPLGIAVDSTGRIYLGDEATGSVSVFDAQWSFLYKLGAGDGEFQMPNHIALDPVSNTVYVADSQANAVKVFSGATLVTQFGSAGAENGEFDFPTGISVSTNGEVFVVDQNNDRVEVFDRAGNFTRKYKYGGMLGPSGRKQGALVDGAGRLYIVDAFQGSVKVVNAATGGAVTTLGSFGDRAGQLSAPAGIALDVFNRLFVASVSNARIELYGLDAFLHLSASPDGGVITAGTNLLLSVTTGGAFTFQWLKDGAPVTDATNNTLNLTVIAIGDAGNYAVVATGPSGVITSSVTQVAVQSSPQIVANPANQTVLAGTNVQFAVSTVGSALSFQWQFNGLNLDGATNSTLTLPEVQATDSGNYVVVVSNAVGSLASVPANLRVVVPPAVMEMLAFELSAEKLPVFTFNAEPNYRYSIDVSSNMMDWTSAVDFNHAGGIADFTDDAAAGLAQRFYRLRWTP